MSLREVVAFGFLACGLLMTVSFFLQQPLNTQAFDAGAHTQRTEPNKVVEARVFVAPTLDPTPVKLSTTESSIIVVNDRPEMVRSVQAKNRPWPQSEFALAVAIQKNLVRLGCYSGTPDGRWTKPVRNAMERLNSRLNAVLPTEKPDDALLALARSQTARVCGSKLIARGAATSKTVVVRSTDVGLADDNDRSLEQFEASHRMSLGTAFPKNDSLSARGRKATSKNLRQARRNTVSRVEHFLHPLGRQ